MRIGGPDALQALVGAMYFHAMSDPRLSRFFTEASSERLLRHQFDFMRLALDGELTEAMRSQIYHGHSTLVNEAGLTERHFELLVSHLRTALRDFQIDENTIDLVIIRIEATREIIFPAN